LDAFHQLENVSRELQLSKEDLEAKILELDRLSAAEEKNRETITVRISSDFLYGVVSVFVPVLTESFPSKPLTESASRCRRIQG
jgi:hypothetical protein